MGTRSDIIVHLSNGKWKRVYCHWDGYISGVGATLFEHYNSQERAEALVGPGAMSSLGEHCSRPEGHTFENPVKGYTIYYGRDRGEKNVEGTTGDTLASVWPPKDSWTEFTYVWSGDKWGVADPDDRENKVLIPLGHALKVEEEGENPIKSLIKSPFGPLAKRT